MNCNEATPLVTAFADGEVDGLRGHSVRRHLEGCAECTAKYQAVLALRGRLRTEVPYFVAPATLRARGLLQRSPLLHAIAGRAAGDGA